MIRLRFPRSIGSIKKVKKKAVDKKPSKKADNKSHYDVFPCIASQYKHTPLHYAASKNNVSEARCLISSGADVDAQVCYDTHLYSGLPPKTIWKWLNFLLPREQT